jgi:hypothetical protein
MKPKEIPGGKAVDHDAAQLPVGCHLGASKGRRFLKGQDPWRQESAFGQTFV